MPFRRGGSLGGTPDFPALRRALAAPGPRPHAIPKSGCHVYGAGGFGRRIARELMRLDQKVLGFIDVAGRERASVDGLPCRHPDDLGDVGGTAYVHGLMNHATAPQPVVAWAESRGFADLCFPADLYAIPGFSIESYWMTPDLDTGRHLREIEVFHDALEDDESRAILRQLVAYRVSTDPRNHPVVTTADAYVPEFLPIRARSLTFIDGGAYTGDTLESLLAHRVPVNDWIAFEPDGDNMAALRVTAQRYRDAVDSQTLIQAGLSDVNGTVRFRSGGGAASRIVSPDERGGDGSPAIQLPVLRLDDVVRRSGAIYVKLDIEGAEIAALHGMRQLLTQRPTLAVSVYHRPSDLWEIPRVIAALYERPRLRLRQHGHHGFDTVLYVMPG